MTGILASVRSMAEAMAALEAGADIIDLKEPREGALGAVRLEIVSACVSAIGGRRPVSATIGDVPFEPGAVVPRVDERRRAGVDFVKIGVLECGRNADTLSALRRLADKGARLVAVLFADAMPVQLTLRDLSAAGFAGVMLDTAAKTGRRLPDIMDTQQLRRFVCDAKALGLMTGLAGSLHERAAARLAPLGADYLGFRGALCRHGDRGSVFDPTLFGPLKAAIVSASQEAAA